MRDVFDWLPPNTPATIRYGTDLSEPMAGTDGREILFGKGGDDLLIGGGLRDILSGGAGADQFYFDIVPTIAKDADVILDFKGRDSISLAFNFLPVDPGKPKYGSSPDTLDPDSFVVGRGPKDADDFVIYRKKTGALYIDTDGTGPETMHKVAILANKAKIDASDIVLG